MSAGRTKCTKLGSLVTGSGRSEDRPRTLATRQNSLRRRRIPSQDVGRMQRPPSTKPSSRTSRPLLQRQQPIGDLLHVIVLLHRGHVGAWTCFMGRLLLRSRSRKCTLVGLPRHGARQTVDKVKCAESCTVRVVRGKPGAGRFRPARLLACAGQRRAAYPRADRAALPPQPLPRLRCAPAHFRSPPDISFAGHFHHLVGPT